MKRLTKEQKILKECQSMRKQIEKNTIKINNLLHETEKLARQIYRRSLGID